MKPLTERALAKERNSASSGKEVPSVSVFEMGIAFTFIRRAALDEVADDVLHPLRDRYAIASLTEEGCHRGMMILRIHYDYPDTPTPVMRRIESFVRLLRLMTTSRSEAWTRFHAGCARFVPIVHAIAGCSVRSGRPFAMAEFLSMATEAPVTISRLVTASRVQ